MPVLVWVVACDAIEEAVVACDAIEEAVVACDDSSEEGAAVVQRAAYRTASEGGSPRQKTPRCPAVSGVVAVRDGVEGCSWRQLVYINTHIKLQLRAGSRSAPASRTVPGSQC